MDNKRVFPTVISNFKEEEYNRTARYLVKCYKNDIYPILLRFGLCDDEHIKKYLGCTTVEEIYKDAMQRNKEKILFLEQEAEYNEEDFWKILRDESSPVKKPYEDGFVFKKMPYSDYYRRELIIKSLSVENREININTDILQAGAVVVPSERQKELYNIVAGFCDELKNKGFSKLYVGKLLYNSHHTGMIVPSIGGILGQVLYYIKND